MRLRGSSTRKFIIEALEKGDREIWCALSESNGLDSGSWVDKNNLTRNILTNLPGELLVAIKCFYGTIAGWLFQNACKVTIGWFRSEYPDRDVLETIHRIEKMHQEVCLPIEICFLAGIFRIDSQLLQLAINLKKNRFGIYKGYVGRIPIAARTLRAIRLHLICSHRYPNQNVTVDNLIADYSRIYSDDDIIYRDAILAMNANRHLFLRLKDEGCAAVGTLIGNGEYIDAGDGLRMSHADLGKEIYFWRRSKSKQSAEEMLKKIVGTRGICHRSEITKDFKEKSGGRFSLLNIMLHIDISGHFTRLAPGVYGLKNMACNLDPISAVSDQLLRKKDCFFYVIARYAGEPLNAYPLWTPAMERKWCIWADKYGGQRLFESLLSIVNPTLWRTSESERTEWQSKKKWHGFYQLEKDLRRPIWRKIPKLTSVLKVAVCTKRDGSMNWVRINRILGGLPHDQRATSVLALLVALGGVAPANHWQQSHDVGPGIELLVSTLANEFYMKGAVEWQDGPGLTLCEQLRESCIREDHGWIDAEDLKILVRMISGEKISREILDKRLNQIPQQLELPF